MVNKSESCRALFLLSSSPLHVCFSAFRVELHALLKRRLTIKGFFGLKMNDRILAGSGGTPLDMFIFQHEIPLAAVYLAPLHGAKDYAPCRGEIIGYFVEFSTCAYLEMGGFTSSS